MAPTSACDPSRVVADLRELQAITADRDGAQRVAWTETWRAARHLYTSKLKALDLEPVADEAGNLWTHLPGTGAGYLLIGSHLDSVPNGGWLDGALGVMAGLELARTVRREQRQLGLALVDFADEEGSRFGRSLFGSSAVSGSLNISEIAHLADSKGACLGEVVTAGGVDLRGIGEAARRLDDVAAYLELHIEQGAVLEEAGASVGVVRGVLGIERLRIVIRGAAGHAGATPMSMRSDALMALADGLGEVEREAHARGGLITVGELKVSPGIVTAIPGEVTFSCDLRHEEREELRGLLSAALSAFQRASAARSCEFGWSLLWGVEPTAFAPRLIEVAREASTEVTGTFFELVSGPGHDAVEMARRVPSVMVFAPSKGGVSHVATEDTAEEDLHRAITVFATTALRLLDDPSLVKGGDWARGR